jgi:hypothetical protein
VTLELWYSVFGGCIGAGLLVGALVAIVNSWGA